jgi:hypothetical protein
MQVVHRFPNDGSIEYRQSTYAMVLVNALALARLRGENYTREEIHMSTIENMPMAKKFIDKPLTPEILKHIDASAVEIYNKCRKLRLGGTPSPL